MVLAVSVGDGGILLGVTEDVRDKGGSGSGALHASEHLYLSIRKVAVDLLPVGNIAFVEVFKLIAGDLFEPGVGDLFGDNERLAVDTDNMVDEVVIGVSIRQLVLNVARGVADIVFLVANLLDTGTGV